MRALEVLATGGLTTIQDHGRTGWAHLGVPRGGALDRAAAEHANRLVGNPPGAAVLARISIAARRAWLCSALARASSIVCHNRARVS